MRRAGLGRKVGTSCGGGVLRDGFLSQGHEVKRAHYIQFLGLR